MYNQRSDSLWMGLVGCGLGLGVAAFALVGGYSPVLPLVIAGLGVVHIAIGTKSRRQRGGRRTGPSPGAPAGTGYKQALVLPAHRASLAPRRRGARGDGVERAVCARTGRQRW